MKTIRRTKFCFPEEEGVARKTMRNQLLIQLGELMEDGATYEVSFREEVESRERRNRLAITLRYIETFTR